MQALGMDLSDTSLADTPMRVARMYVNETFRGLSAKNFPRISFFEKAPGTPEMIVVNDITLYSYCEHHFVPFFGKVHVAYIPGDRLLGLSKVNRVVDYLSRKPHLQERLTREIADTLSELLQTRHVAVFVEAQHLCVASRGVRDAKSITRTGCYLGQFQNTHTRAEFMASLKMQGSL
ncbi:GTP cyclohydrolase I [Robiginitalea biformata HTCC2501]|uniref:GTP cyclohydrolase 1 n=2 Tax=Robiginitalea TaxID=252306 RepID=A4CGT7_ROBBH|nr:GTP cyclohydrolase I [Robiginitalea biformata HTCC2501]